MPLSTATAALAARVIVAVLRFDRSEPADDERGQATAEYALVLLGAAAIALLLVSWATKTNVIAKLLDLVFGHLTDRATKAG
jgi:Flp pilus assembly pilin Flp